MPRRILLALGWRGIPSQALSAGTRREDALRLAPERRPWLARLLSAPALARLAPRLALRVLDPRAPAFGLAGERLVERTLRARGWRFLARRLATRWAELDLLFVAGETLVVVEVKTGRAGPRHRPGQRLGADSLARLRGAARGLARGAPSRVDLVEVQLDRTRRPRLVHHPDLRRPLGGGSGTPERAPG